MCVCACVGVEGVGCLCINTQKNTPLPNKISLHYVHFTFPVVFSERKFWPFFTSKTSCHSNTGQLLINPPHFAQQKSDGMPAHRLTDNVHTPGVVSYNFSTLVWQSKSQQWLKKWQPNNTQLVLSNKWKINIVRQLKIQPSEYFFFYTYIRLPSHEQTMKQKYPTLIQRTTRHPQVSQECNSQLPNLHSKKVCRIWLWNKGFQGFSELFAPGG